jgi:hypothetical protein
MPYVSTKLLYLLKPDVCRHADNRCGVVRYLFAGHRSQPLNRPFSFQVWRAMIQESVYTIANSAGGFSSTTFFSGTLTKASSLGGGTAAPSYMYIFGCSSA